MLECQCPQVAITVPEKSVPAGETLTFRKGDSLNGGAAWATSEERKRLEPWTVEDTDDIVLWRTAVVPRVTLDRISSASG